MPSKRYRAFISYSQRDKSAARRLQRWLETYRVPRGVVVDGAANRRLGRFFRDDEELAASADLAGTLRGAIEDTDNLIVICSPHAAQSKWVNAEIEHFRRSAHGDTIFAVIVGGTPNSGDPATECFPPALRSTTSAVDGMAVEPLALSLSTESKRRLGAKLAAGLLNISFDDLWRREQRRHRARVMQWSAASLALVAILGLLGYRLVDARRSARARERAATLATAIDTLGANAAAAIGSVRELLRTDRADQTVDAVADVIASWARTPVETGFAFQMPRLFTSGTRLVLQTSDGLHDIGDTPPVRRIGFSGERLVVIFRERIVAVEQRSGQRLDVMETSAAADLPWFEWGGLAFETSDGTGIIAGRHFGVSNGLLWDALLRVSPSGKLSVINKLELRDDQVVVSSACDTIGVGAMEENVGGNAVPPSSADSVHIVESTGGAAGGPLRVFPPDKDRWAAWRNDVETSVSKRGCRNTAFDSDSSGRHPFTSLAGVLLSADTSASPATPADWHSSATVSTGVSPHPATWRTRPAQISEGNPCARGCRKVDDQGRQEEFDGEPGLLGPGWVETSLPPGGLSAGAVAEDFAANPLYTFHEQHNVGVESVWCRHLGGQGLTCVTASHGGEYSDDWSDIDLRSTSGRFIFYTTGTLYSFAVLDVQAMRVATPDGNRAGSHPGVAAFSSAADQRLFVFSDNRLSAFEPDAATGRFVDISASLPWQRRLGGTDDADPVVAMVSHPSDDLIAASENGVLIRFDWRTGRAMWSRRLLSLGNVRAIRRSPGATYVAVVGERGIRVVRTRDGLLASGVLIPPYYFDPGFDLARCAEDAPASADIMDALTEVTLEESGAVTASCGASRFTWTPRTYSGDTLIRMEALLPAPASSP